jgi:hypothetical protein
VALKESNSINKPQNEQGYSVNIENEDALKDLLNNSEKHLEIYKILGGLE